MDTKLRRGPENSAVEECKGGGSCENWFGGNKMKWVKKDNEGKDWKYASRGLVERGCEWPS